MTSIASKRTDDGETPGVNVGPRPLTNDGETPGVNVGPRPLTNDGIEHGVEADTEVESDSPVEGEGDVEKVVYNPAPTKKRKRITSDIKRAETYAAKRVRARSRKQANPKHVSDITRATKDGRVGQPAKKRRFKSGTIAKREIKLYANGDLCLAESPFERVVNDCLSNHSITTTRNIVKRAGDGTVLRDDAGHPLLVRVVGSDGTSVISRESACVTPSKTKNCLRALQQAAESYLSDVFELTDDERVKQRMKTIKIRHLQEAVEIMNERTTGHKPCRNDRRRRRQRYMNPCNDRDHANKTCACAKLPCSNLDKHYLRSCACFHS